MIFERTLIYASHNPYSIYFRLAVCKEDAGTMFAALKVLVPLQVFMPSCGRRQRMGSRAAVHSRFRNVTKHPNKNPWLCSWNSKVPPSIPPPSQNKVQIGLDQALSGPSFGMGVGIEGGTFDACAVWELPDPQVPKRQPGRRSVVIQR